MVAGKARQLCTISRENVGLKLDYDKNALRRELIVKDLVLIRRPGMSSKLSENWHGPYQIVKRGVTGIIELL